MNYLGFDVGISMLSIYDEDGFLGVQVDAYGEEDSGVHPYEAHSPFGLLARPLDPELDAAGQPRSDRACQVLYALEGGRGHAIPLGDPRVILKLPQLEKGETLLYSAFGQFVRLDSRGAITLFTTDDGSVDGASVYFQVAPDGFRWVAPWGMLTFDATGFHVIHASGARIDLGGIYGLPAPLDQVTSYASFQAGAVSADASAVTLGPGAGHMPLAAQPPLQAYLASIAMALGAIQKALAGFVPGTGGANFPPPLTAAVSAAIDTVATPPVLASTATASL